MLQVRIDNGAAIVRQFERMPETMRAELGRGIAAATALLREDVVAHTPRRSGKARENVLGWLRTDQGRVASGAGGDGVASGTVQYGYKDSEAWYMRIFLSGARAHRIEVKGRASVRALLRRRERRARKEQGFFGSGPVQVAGSGTARALRIPWVFAGAGSGAFFSKFANHPGQKPERLLTRRLAANAGRITAILRQSVDRAVAMTPETYEHVRGLKR